MSDEFRTLPTQRISDYPQQQDMPKRRGYGAYAAPPADPAAPHSIHDVALVLGLPAEKIDPVVLEAVGRLLVGLGNVRAELDLCRHRIEWLEHNSDNHPSLPCLHARAFVRAVEAWLAGGAESGVVAVIHATGLPRLRLIWGLKAASSALEHLASRIVAATGPGNVIGFLGGSDFAVMMPGTDQAFASTLMEGIDASVNEPPFSWHGQSVTLDLSIGLWPMGQGQDAETLLAAADGARHSGQT